MKKLLMLGVAAVSMGALPAVAKEGGAGKPGLFEKYDTNADGSVTKEEYMAHATKKFEELDADKNGSISKAESDAKRAEWKAKMKEHRQQMNKQKVAPAPVPETAPVE